LPLPVHLRRIGQGKETEVIFLLRPNKEGRLFVFSISLTGGGASFCLTKNTFFLSIYAGGPAATISSHSSLPNGERSRVRGLFNLPIYNLSVRRLSRTKIKG